MSLRSSADFKLNCCILCPMRTQHLLILNPSHIRNVLRILSAVVVVGPLPRPSPIAPGPARARTPGTHPSLHLSSISISKRATYRRRATKGRGRGRYVKNCQNVSLSLLGLFLAAGCSSGRKHENALSLLGEGRTKEEERQRRERGEI